MKEPFSWFGGTKDQSDRRESHPSQSDDLPPEQSEEPPAEYWEEEQEKQECSDTSDE